MKKDIALSIAVGSLLAISLTNSAYANEKNAKNTEATQVDSKAPSSSGKCASGKCGTEKIYSKAEISHDPQAQLVRTRDGKCGLTGEGIDKNTPQQIETQKSVNGVCGQ
ncbi:TPA: hypothetical protein VEO38_001467 [Providencia alcalifaciens]|nr:hypothetical protein [Providencia alcalifaciens]